MSEGKTQRWIRVIALKHFADECLFWPFAVSSKTGYPVTWRPNGGARSASIGAHALVCEYVNGPKPTPEHEAAHSCGTRRCVAGLHLSWKTKIDNAADRIKHGTHREGAAVAHKVKLTKKQAAFVKSSALSGVDIAAKFCVTPSAISAIRRGRNWKSA